MYPVAARRMRRDLGKSTGGSPTAEVQELLPSVNGVHDVRVDAAVAVHVVVVVYASIRLDLIVMARLVVESVMTCKLCGHPHEIRSDLPCLCDFACIGRDHCVFLAVTVRVRVQMTSNQP